MNDRYLKYLAEDMGYMIYHWKDGVFQIGTRPNGGNWVYTDFTLDNADTLLEVFDHFNMEVERDKEEKTCIVYILMTDDPTGNYYIEGEGNTLRDAVKNAIEEKYGR